MTADLLPNMNLPYAAVMTTYPGASPEEVEASVTRPIEQSMATVSSIQQVQSVSQENVSMVILEFGQEADMDSVTLEMREKLDQDPRILAGRGGQSCGGEDESDHAADHGISSQCRGRKQRRCKPDDYRKGTAEIGKY